MTQHLNTCFAFHWHVNNAGKIMLVTFMILASLKLQNGTRSHNLMMNPLLTLIENILMQHATKLYVT